MAKHGMPGIGGINQNMMKQLQKMQNDMMRTQEELEIKEYSSSSGGGAVKAVVSGKRELLRLEISPTAVDPDDTEMLSDLVCAAVNEALRQAEETMNREMGKFTGGMGMPF